MRATAISVTPSPAPTNNAGERPRSAGGFALALARCSDAAEPTAASAKDPTATDATVATADAEVTSDDDGAREDVAAADGTAQAPDEEIEEVDEADILELDEVEILTDSLATDGAPPMDATPLVPSNVVPIAAGRDTLALDVSAGAVVPTDAQVELVAADATVSVATPPPPPARRGLAIASAPAIAT
ncbi:MAG TPA: hypothetical protein VFG69_18530, partial [Nannocystaceae bacterium]|nr:hypothetical protein [Nannocystaceae bacterium]